MKLFLGWISFVVVACISPMAFAQSVDWTNSGTDSNFDNGQNWTTPTATGTVPGPGDSMHIFPGFTTSAATIDIAVNLGGPLNVTINATQNESVYGFLVSSTFYKNSAPGGSLNFNFGTTNSPTTLTVGTEGTVITGGATVYYNGNFQTSSQAIIGVTAVNSPIDVGQVSGTGTLYIKTGNFSFNSGSSLLLGDGFDGTVYQGSTGSSASPTVTFSSAELAIGGAANGTYNLQSGSLNIGTTPTDTSILSVGNIGTSVSGVLNQTGGTLTAAAATNVIIGEFGTGSYNLSGGSADFQNGFTVGANGSVNQSNSVNGNNIVTSSLSAENTVTIGTNGTYTISGGNATFNNGLVLNGTLNLNSSTLNGQTQTGVVQVGEDVLTGSGTIVFGGGTLKLTSGATTAFADSFSGTLSNGTSTIDASSAGLDTYTFNNTLVDGTSSGGISLIGDGSTVFSFGGGTTNTYTGVTGVTAGILNTSVANIASSSTLSMGSGGAINLTNLAPGGFTFNGLGGLTGSGYLNVNLAQSGDTLTIASKSSSFTGTIGIGNNGNGGTVQLYGGTFGNIDFNNVSSDVVIGGNLSNLQNGSVTFASANPYINTGANTIQTTIDSGFSLSGTNLNGIVDNAGALNLSGTFTGTVNTNSGSLSASQITGNVISNSGSLNVTTITGNVATNTGSLGATTIGGSVGTGSSTGLIYSNSASPTVPNATTLSIGGSLLSNGTIGIRINGDSNTSDLISVTGSTTVSGNVQATNVGKSKAIGSNPVTTTYTILDSSSVTATGPISSPSASAIYSYNVVVNPTNLQLQVTQNPLTMFAQNKNQRAVAQALDGTANNLITTVYQYAPASAIPNLLSQNSPQALQYSRNIAFENSTFMVQTVNGALSNFRDGYAGLDTSALNVLTPGFTSGLGRSMGTLLASNSPAFHQNAPNGVNYYPGGDDSTPSSSPLSPSSNQTTISSSSSSSPTGDSSGRTISDSPVPLHTISSSTLRSSQFSEFIGGDAILADLNQNSSANNKASSTGGDAVAGVNFRMTSHLSAGVLFDYNHTDAKTDGYGSKTTINTYSPGIFGTYFDHGFYLNGLFSFGFNTYNQNRYLPATGETANSSPNGQQYVANLDTGYDFHPWSDWTVGPTLGVTYVHLNVDSFTETGAQNSQSDLAVQSQSANSVRSRLGGHLVYQTHVGSVLLQPNFSAMWQHEYLNDSSAINYQFSDFGSAQESFYTANPSRDSALISCGLTANLDSNMALYLNYIADVGASNFFAQSVIGGFKASF